MSTLIAEIDYKSARDEYLKYLINNPGVISVIEFGEIKVPGLSDIDWIVVLDDKEISNCNYLIMNDTFSENAKLAFQHRPIFYPICYIKYSSI